MGRLSIKCEGLKIVIEGSWDYIVTNPTQILIQKPIYLEDLIKEGKAKLGSTFISDGENWKEIK